MNEIFDEAKRTTFEPPMTNFEWIHSLDDIELAILIAKTITEAVLDEKTISMFGALNWLRETHKEEEK